MTLVLNVLNKKSLWDIQGEKSGRKIGNGNLTFSPAGFQMNH